MQDAPSKRSDDVGDTCKKPWSKEVGMASFLPEGSPSLGKPLKLSCQLRSRGCCESDTTLTTEPSGRRITVPWWSGDTYPEVIIVV